MAEESYSKLSSDTDRICVVCGRPYAGQHRHVKGYFGDYVDYYKEMDEVRQHYEDEK